MKKEWNKITAKRVIPFTYTLTTILPIIMNLWTGTSRIYKSQEQYCMVTATQAPPSLIKRVAKGRLIHGVTRKGL